MSDKYPYYCVEPDCGIRDCNECPFSPVVHYKKIEALEKEIKMDSGICLKDQLGNLYVRMKSQENAWYIRTKVQQELENKIEALEKKLFENSGDPEHILISRELFNRFKAWCWEHDRGLYEELKEVETQ